MSFTPDHRIYKMIDLLNRCKCDLCQKEKKKWEDKLTQTAAVKPPEKLEDSMQGVNEIEYWRSKAHDYEWLYHEQQDIAKGYKEIIEEYKRKLKELHIEKAMAGQLLAKI